MTNIFLYPKCRSAFLIIHLASVSFWASLAGCLGSSEGMRKRAKDALIELRMVTINHLMAEDIEFY